MASRPPPMRGDLTVGPVMRTLLMFSVPAMPKPKAAPATRNMMMLALAVAASASSPISRPTQIELIVPESD